MPDDFEPSDARFRDALADLYRPGAEIPRSVEDAIIRRARAHLLTGPRRWRIRAAAAAAAAAVVAACMTVAVWLGVTRTPSTRQVATLAGDIDRNGRVDIVDAMLLARAIESRRAQDDFNRDGIVDRRDVDAIALLAVKLDAGHMR
jgi:hypothetical protein